MRICDEMTVNPDKVVYQRLSDSVVFVGLDYPRVLRLVFASPSEAEDWFEGPSWVSPISYSFTTETF